MTRVLIVDDEPTALQYIAMMINTRCEGIEIVGQADGGRTAVEILKDTMVDIVIADIQMADMNGIELASWIHQHKPGVMTLIISGYSDFEYAKAAISTGVVDYLLKPIRPAEFTETMEKLSVVAKKRKREAREKWLISGISSGEFIFDTGLWPQEPLVIGAVLRGGVICDARLPAGSFPYSLKLPEELAAVYIRDETKICFAMLPDGRYEQERIVEELSCGSSYYTAFFKTVTPGENCASLIEMLDATMKIAIPGYKQVREYARVNEDVEKPAPGEMVLLNNLRYAIKNSQHEKIKTGLNAIFAYWEAENTRLEHAEQILSLLLRLMSGYILLNNDKVQADSFDIAALICREASDYPDMLEKTWNHCEKSFERRKKGGQIFRNIEDYIREHMGDPLSTQLVCDVFNISVSYLSQLFRKHRNMSFVEYVTYCRIEEAKRLLVEFPDMPIKTIAAQLGFSDQFYFSKVFRSVTGAAPSEYKASDGRQ